LVFRLKPEGALTDPELNLLNQRLHTRLDARSDVFLTPTMLHSEERDVYCLRFAIGSLRTTWEDVQKSWSVVVEEGKQVLADRAADE
jgi:hypothetical protein